MGSKVVNVFGERICDKNCPAWYDGGYKRFEYGGFCEARMDFTGRVAPIDGKAQYGLLCKLPVGFQVIRDEL